MIQKSASVIWSGAGKNGTGEMTTQSGVLQSVPYGYATRFEDKPGANPEELIGAAHASCFTMALSFKLEEAGFKDQELRTTAVVSFGKDEKDCMSVLESALSLKAKVFGITEIKFKEIAEAAKKDCPISRLLNAKITLHAELN
jgi:osmotically inducible protein OsmC